MTITEIGLMLVALGMVSIGGMIGNKVGYRWGFLPSTILALVGISVGAVVGINWPIRAAIRISQERILAEATSATIIGYKPDGRVVVEITANNPSTYMDMLIDPKTRVDNFTQVRIPDSIKF